LIRELGGKQGLSWRGLKGVEIYLTGVAPADDTGVEKSCLALWTY